MQKILATSILLSITACGYLEPGPPSAPVFSQTTGTTSISVLSDGRLEVRNQRAQCLLESDKLESTVTTFSLGGITKAGPTAGECLFLLASDTLKFIVRIFLP